MKEFVIVSEADLFSTNLKNKVTSKLFDKGKKHFDYMDPRSIDDDALDNLITLQKLIINNFKKKFKRIVTDAYNGKENFDGEHDQNSRINCSIALYYCTYYNSNMNDI